MTKNKCPDCGDEHETSAPRCERHSAWTNRETHDIALMLDQVEFETDRNVFAAGLCLAPCSSDEDASRHAFEDKLRERYEYWHERAQVEASDTPSESGRGRRELAAQMFQAALARVNWRELAEHYIRKARESAAVRA